jgi:hypothetical protein
MRPEIEAALCSAVRGVIWSIDDASLQQVLVFAGSYIEPFIPAAFLDYLDDQSAFLASVVGELPCLEIDSVPTAATVPPCGFSFTVSGMMISPFLTSLSSERLNQHAIAERFHIDCHMFCITPGSGPERCIQCCA